MHLAQEKKINKAALDNAKRYIQQLKAAKTKMEVCVVIGDIEEDKTEICRSTIYRRADVLA